MIVILSAAGTIALDSSLFTIAVVQAKAFPGVSLQLLASYWHKSGHNRFVD